LDDDLIKIRIQSKLLKLLLEVFNAIRIKVPISFVTFRGNLTGFKGVLARNAMSKVRNRELFGRHLSGTLGTWRQSRLLHGQWRAVDFRLAKEEITD